MGDMPQLLNDSLLQPLAAYGTWLIENIITVFGLMVAAVVMVGSAAVSGTIAELRFRAPMIHFVLGLMAPVAYPALIWFSLPARDEGAKKRKKEDDADKKAERDTMQTSEGPPPVEAAPRARAEVLETISESNVSVQGPAYDQAFFHGIARDEMGHPRGPFRVVIEKREIRVERILDVLPHVVVVETGTSGRVQTLRLPYGKIDLCEEI